MSGKKPMMRKEPGIYRMRGGGCAVILAAEGTLLRGVRIHTRPKPLRRPDIWSDTGHYIQQPATARPKRQHAYDLQNRIAEAV